MDKQFSNMDHVTDCKNIAALAEAVASLCTEQRGTPCSLVVLDVNAMSQINRQRGHLEGDKILQWLAQLLEDQLQETVYRLGNDEFVALFAGESQEQINQLACMAFESANAQARDWNLPIPLASIAVIHYADGDMYSAEEVFSNIFHAVGLVKSADRTIQVFGRNDLVTEGGFRSPGWMAYSLVERLVYMERKLEELAYTDPITSLPNQRSAQIQLYKAISKSTLGKKPLSILLIDGDDLHRYNEISYLAGDQMIYQLGQAIRQSLRPDDFLARWRVGDEFVVLLEGMDKAQGVMVGERICKCVEQTSQQWLFPVTVSIGVASFPEHGETPEALFNALELANQTSKQNGKNRVTLYCQN